MSGAREYKDLQRDPNICLNKAPKIITIIKRGCPACSKTDSGNCSAGRGLPTAPVSAGAEGAGLK